MCAVDGGIETTGQKKKERGPAKEIEKQTLKHQKIRRKTGIFNVLEAKRI